MIEILLLNIINEKDSVRNYNIASLRKGIYQYINDNGLTVFEKQTKDERILKDMLRIYLEPIVIETENSLCDYFANYEELRDFDLLSKKALKFAIARFRGVQIDANEIICLKESAEGYAGALYQISSLRPYVERIYSEVLVNLEYAGGQSNNISKSLLDYIK